MTLAQPDRTGGPVTSEPQRFMAVLPVPDQLAGDPPMLWYWLLDTWHTALADQGGTRLLGPLNVTRRDDGRWQVVGPVDERET